MVSFFISLVSHFQSHQFQPTTGSFQSHKHLEERNMGVMWANLQAIDVKFSRDLTQQKSLKSVNF